MMLFLGNFDTMKTRDCSNNITESYAVKKLEVLMVRVSCTFVGWSSKGNISWENFLTLKESRRISRP